MDKNTENAIVNALGDIHVTLDHIRKDFTDVKHELTDVKKTINVFAEKAVDKLESIDGKLSHTTNLKQEVERHTAEIESIKRQLKML